MLDYKGALNFLEANTNLLEDPNYSIGDFYKKVENIYRGYSYENFFNIWGAIIEICYNPEINIDLLKNSAGPIPMYCFENCQNIKTIDIPDLITRLGASAFAECTSLKEVTGMKSVKQIGESSFFKCFSLETIDIPDSVEAICALAFWSCHLLKEVTGMKSVEYIDDCAFDGCTSLETIYISDSVTYIGDDVFNDCPKLVLQISKNNQYAINYAERYKIKYELV